MMRNERMISKRIVLRFPRRLVGEPVVSNLVKRFGLDFNILKASVTPNEEGVLVLSISGAEDACGAAIEYLAGAGVGVEPLSDDVTRDEARCTQCGACTSVCTSGALSVDRPTMEVWFDSDKCVVCRQCVGACPMRAIRVGV
jgi:L-aspartate semialdehyde sulfurtransferase ferredoxin